MRESDDAILNALETRVSPPHARGPDLPAPAPAADLTDAATLDGNLHGLPGLVLGAAATLGGLPEPEPETETTLRALAERLGDVFWVADACTHTTIYVSPAFAELWGRSPANLLADPTTFMEGIHPDDRERVRAALPRQLDGTYAQEYRVVRPDGSVRWVLDRAMPIRDAGGQVRRIAGIAQDVTTRRELEQRAQQAAAETHARLEAESARAAVVGILGRITDGFLALDGAWDFTFANARAEELLGQPPGSLPGKHVWTVFPLARESVWGREFERALRENVSVHFEAASTAVDRWFTVHAYPGDAGLSVYFQDVTERTRAEHDLRESERRYRSLFEESRDAIYMTSRDGRILDANAAFLELLAWPRNELIGRNALEMYVHPEDRAHFQSTVEASGAVRNFEVRLRRKDGVELECMITATVWTDRLGETGYQGTIRDVTERKAMEATLRHHALHDALTSLPNRSNFLERLRRALERAAADPAYHFAVLFLDLDRFKVVNDSLGHMAGDHLLVEVARRLESAVRPGDTVARLGGDEFAVLLYDLKDREDVIAVAERIQERLRQPHRVEGQEVFTTASVGIALSSADYEKPEEILRDADTAMYRAKALGGVSHQTFDHTMHAEAMALLHLETDLRRAVDRNEFEVYYQPIVSLETGATIGFEALARWQHPERGLILPAEFIPLAEETGLIVPIGWWVLREACSSMAAWNARLRPPRQLMLSVNLSARQLMQPDLPEGVQAIVRDTRLGGGLRLEITESAIMAHPETAEAVFHRLRQGGIELCIDDFGTGYSSLAHLHRFPVSLLKIDRSFVSRLGKDAYNLEIVRAIVGLAENLGIDAIAEGVETMQQRDRLLSLGSRLAQGFLFSVPLPHAEAEARLERELRTGGC
jgi:diguanylate cyclase (GGDEF)-like protein/PAS domain S-box-containing protein